MTTPTGSSAERLRAAAEATRVASAVTDAWNAPPPDPAPGQVWRARWGAIHQLVVLVSVMGNTATATPVSLDEQYADDTAALLTQDQTTLGAPIVLWRSLIRPLPVRVLDRLAGQVTPAGLGLLEPSATLVATHHGTPIVTALDPRAEYRAVLADTMTALAAASWAPHGDGSLPSLLRAVGIGPAELVKILDIGPPQALQVARGGQPITQEQAQLLAVHVGRSVEALMDANAALPEELIEHLDRPARRARVTQLAHRRRQPEQLAWQNAAYEVFAMAARQTGKGAGIAWDERIDRYFTVVLDE